MSATHNVSMFETMFECSPDACLLIENKRFVRCNQAAVAMLRADSKERIFNTHPSALSPDIQPDGRYSYEKAEEMMAAVTPDSGPVQFEWMHKRMDGELFPVEVSITPVKEGNRVLFYTVWRDISARKRAEAEVREKDAQIRLLLQSTAEGIYGIDTNGICTFCNPSGLQLLGYEKEEQLLGTDIHALIHHTRPDGSHYPASECRIHNAFRFNAKVHADDELFWRPDGSSFYAEYWSQPIVEDGVVKGAVVACVDITDRKQATEALLKRENQLQSIIERIGTIHTRNGSGRLLPEVYDGDLGLLSSTFNKMVAEFDLQQDELVRVQSEMRQQKAFAEEILNKAAVPIFVLDVNHRIIVWNSAIADLTGFKSKKMIGTDHQWMPFYESERPVLADLVLSANETQLQELYGTYRTSLHMPGGVQTEAWFGKVGGLRRYLIFDAAPIFDENGVKLGVIETLLDITQRKLNEIELAASREALLEQHKKLNKVFKQMERAKREWEETMDCISDIVLMCDTFGKIKRFNRSITELSGLPFEEITGKNWMTLLSEFGVQVVDFNGQHGSLFDPKSQRSFEVNVSPIMQPGSPLQSGTVVSIHDTTVMKTMNSKLEKAYTELQQTQSQILQQEKMASIGQLAAGVAHEINNPMGFISSNLSSLGKYMEKIGIFNNALLEAIQSECNPDTVATLEALRKKMKIDFILGDISGLLAESHDGAERVRRIVRDLKSFSHIDEVQCKPFSINECLTSTLNMARNEIKYVAEVEQEYDPDLPLLNCYPQQLNQVFMNLLVNAAHAIEGHGVITIKTLRESDTIVIRISDTGKGIAPENLTRIFEPFFTTKEVGKGTGLGLSISYDIIKKHGGVMNVESEVGAGTTFIIRLPLNHSPEGIENRS